MVSDKTIREVREVREAGERLRARQAAVRAAMGRAYFGQRLQLTPAFIDTLWLAMDESVRERYCDAANHLYDLLTKARESAEETT